jgi:hypothetical protein
VIRDSSAYSRKMAGIEFWAPTPYERDFFDLLIVVANGGESKDELAGKAAVDFFSKSGLERPILKTVSRGA